MPEYCFYRKVEIALFHHTQILIRVLAIVVLSLPLKTQSVSFAVNNYDPPNFQNSENEQLNTSGRWLYETTLEMNYCTASAISTEYERIANIKFNTIDHSSTGTEGYEDFTEITTSVTPGSTYEFTGTISNPPFDQDQIIVWIDYNRDGDFEDSGEEVFLSPVGVGPHSSDIAIPSGASPGLTRMRVRLHDSGLGPNTTPCGTSNYGQVEDYSIIINSDACDDTMTLTSPADDITGGIHKYEVNIEIQAGNLIMSGDVIYDAGVSITLTPGFSVMEGTEFTLQIDGCGNQ
jgi:hypothetical protein